MCTFFDGESGKEAEETAMELQWSSSDSHKWQGKVERGESCDASESKQAQQFGTRSRGGVESLGHILDLATFLFF